MLDMGIIFRYYENNLECLSAQDAAAVRLFQGTAVSFL